MNLPFFYFGFAVLLFFSPLVGAEPLPAVVIVPVADVWSGPSESSAALTNDKRETQLLIGERVLIHQSSGAWRYIEAIEQPEFTHHNRWEGYPGWVLKSALGPASSAKENVMGSTTTILEFAAKAVGAPYIWGALSGQPGFDCSGLVHIAYRHAGIQIPRDAYEQWMKSAKIKRSDLKPTDLVFSAKADRPSQVTHVAFYAGDGQLIEAPQAGMFVRKISFKEKFGKDLSSVDTGDRVGDRVIYFGRYIE
jgi:cell wall-associated NlpC family hydrolase